MEKKKEMVINVLKGLAIAYEIYEHPPAPTIEEAKKALEVYRSNTL
jgi:hypothetical protein